MNYTRRIAFIIACASTIIPSLVISAPPVTTVTFQTFDADTGNPLTANISVSEVSVNEYSQEGGEVIGEPIKISGGKYALAKDANSHIALDIDTDSGGQYNKRRLIIFLEGLSKNSKPSYKIFLAKSSDSETIYTRGSVKKASEYINNEWVDRAVALLERIDEGSTQDQKETQFGINLRYNLGRAYLFNCTQHFVDQCKVAKDTFDELYNSYDDKQKFFDNEQITKDKLKKNIDIYVEPYYRRMDYLRAKWNIACERFEDALGIFEKLATEAKNNPSLLNQINLTTEALEKDISFTKSKIDLTKVVSSN
jgi:hypothetical protein